MPQIATDPSDRSGKRSSSTDAAEETASRRKRKRGRSGKVSSSPDAPTAEESDVAAGMSQWRRRWLAKHSLSPSSPATVPATPKRGRSAKHSSSPSSQAPDVAPPAVTGLSQPKHGHWAKYSLSPFSPSPAGSPEVVDAPAVAENLDAAAGMSQWRRSWLAKQSSSPSSPAPRTIVACRMASLSGAESPAEAPSLRKRGKTDVKMEEDDEDEVALIK